jgi:hypothetical protein
VLPISEEGQVRQAHESTQEQGLIGSDLALVGDDSTGAFLAQMNLPSVAVFVPDDGGPGLPILSTEPVSLLAARD